MTIHSDNIRLQPREAREQSSTANHPKRHSGLKPITTSADDAQTREYWVQQVVEFVRGLGIAVAVCTDEAAAESFLPNVEILDGGLVVRPGVFPGDILHEAGHLATMPAQFRPLATGQLREAFAAMSRYLEANPMGLATYPEDPVARGVMQCSDPEATAWQFAAGQHLGMPDEWLFPLGSYAGDAVAVLLSLKAGGHMGINGLQAAGWTLNRANPFRPNIPVFPQLAFWLHSGAQPQASPTAEAAPR